MFASCCKQMQLTIKKPVILGVKADWTANRWVFKCASSQAGGRFDTGSVNIATKAIFMDGGSESCNEFTRKTLPVLTSGVALVKNSAIVKNTQLLFFKPHTPAIRFVPAGALLKHMDSARCTVHTGHYTVHYHAFELEFESRLLCNNNAMPHRDNNDYDKWMELHLHKLVRLCYSRAACQ